MPGPMLRQALEAAQEMGMAKVQADCERLGPRCAVGPSPNLPLVKVVDVISKTVDEQEASTTGPARSSNPELLARRRVYQTQSRI